MPAVKKVVERGVWSEAEHDKFLAALKVYPKGPWKTIAVEVGTRSARQVQTHAQKYFEKVARRVRGLRKDRKKVVRLEHRLGDDAMRLFRESEHELHGAGAATSTRPNQQQQQIDMASAVSSLMTTADAAADTRRREGDESFMALLLAQQDALTLQDTSESVSSCDSDDSEDALAGVDDYYLDFLIQALSSVPNEEFDLEDAGEGGNSDDEV